MFWISCQLPSNTSHTLHSLYSQNSLYDGNHSTLNSFSLLHLITLFVALKASTSTFIMSRAIRQRWVGSGLVCLGSNHCHVLFLQQPFHTQV